MTRAKLFLAAGSIVLGIAASAWADQIGDRARNSFFGRSATLAPAMSLADSRAFPFRSTSAWMSPVNDFLPDWRPANWDSSGTNLSMGWGQPVRNSGAPTMGYSKDSSKDTVDVRRSNLFDYVHGEVGGYFGTSTSGRNRLTNEGAYIFSEVGNENFQISVGAFYDHSDFSRHGR
jgi:hypothetical protein